ncbi:MAG: GNAT family N-acetyltransferase [Clostridia bacterium]|nr:GNAT family N-acetyltransferase [Clostridia bacterium]
MHAETERLVLRSFTAEDLPGFTALITNVMAGPYAAYGDPFPTDEAGLRELLCFLAGTEQFFAVTLRDDGRLIGMFSLNETGREGERNFGFCLHSAYHHHGYAREAGRALIQYAAETPGLDHLISFTAKLNVPAVALLQALGFVITGETDDVSFACDEQGQRIRYVSCTCMKQLI